MRRREDGVIDTPSFAGVSFRSRARNEKVMGNENVTGTGGGGEREASGNEKEGGRERQYVKSSNVSR